MEMEVYLSLISGMIVGASRIKKFQQKLLSWFKSNKRDFPWRNPELSNYQIVISEVLLQRTKAETVARFYPQFIEVFPSWEALAGAGVSEIELYLKPVGLYRQRAKRLHDLSIEMLKRKGQFPGNRDELEQIPFLGQYIANAVELLVLHQPSALLDVNMARLLERYFGERKLADIRYDPYLQGLAKEVVNIKKTKEINWAILDFAALICKARRPLCSECVLNSDCVYYISQDSGIFCKSIS